MATRRCKKVYILPFGTKGDKNMRNFHKHYRHIKQLVTNYKGKTSSFNAKLQKNTLSNSQQ